MPLLVLLFIAVYWKLAGIGLLPRTPLTQSVAKQEAYFSAISVSISTRLAMSNYRRTRP